MTQKNFRESAKRSAILHRIYQQIYYLLLKRHFYGWTSPLRVLPDFIVIGVVRGGTTSLYDNLSKHPCIYSAAYDELGFFDSNFELGVNWYKSLFPSVLRKKISQLKRRCFMTYDVTPFYIYNEAAAKRIASLLPKVKIVALLRNPVDRAYSNYYLGVRDGVEKMSFEDAVAVEMEELKEKESLSLDRYDQTRSYIVKGFYAEQLKIWFELFPKEQMLLLASEDFAREPIKIMNQIFEFLKLPPFEVRNFEKTNLGNYIPMKDDTRRLLTDYFRPHNEKIYRVIGRDFDWD